MASGASAAGDFPTSIMAILSLFTRTEPNNPRHWTENVFVRQLLGHRLARLFTFTAFFGPGLHMSIHREGFARFGTLVATLGTAIGHHGGKRAASCADL